MKRKCPVIKTVACNIHRIPVISDGVLLKGCWNVYFEWYCPACDEMHWAMELSVFSDFSQMSIALRCSFTTIYMPWSKNVKKSRRSIYNQPFEDVKIDWKLPDGFGESSIHDWTPGRAA